MRSVQVTNGSFSLHALTDGGVMLPSKANQWEMLQVIGMDAPVVSIGMPDVLPDISGPPQPEKGFNFCLFNNAAGTNYVMWTPYGDGVGSKMKSRCDLPVSASLAPTMDFGARTVPQGTAVSTSAQHVPAQRISGGVACFVRLHAALNPR